jgi:hypothetical protein
MVTVVPVSESKFEKKKNKFAYTNSTCFQNDLDNHIYDFYTTTYVTTYIITLSAS